MPAQVTSDAGSGNFEKRLGRPREPGRGESPRTPVDVPTYSPYTGGRRPQPDDPIAGITVKSHPLANCFAAISINKAGGTPTLHRHSAPGVSGDRQSANDYPTRDLLIRHPSCWQPNACSCCNATWHYLQQPGRVLRPRRDIASLRRRNEPRPSGSLGSRSNRAPCCPG